MQTEAQQPVKELEPGELRKFRHVCGEIFFAKRFDDGEFDPQIYFYPRLERVNPLDITNPIELCPACHEPLSLDWVRALYRVEPMPEQLANSTIARKNCSNCWQHGFKMVPVEMIDDETGEIETYYRVLCVTCQEETIGYVTTNYIGFTLQRDLELYNASIAGLAEALNMPALMPKKRSQKKNLEELGF